MITTVYVELQQGPTQMERAVPYLQGLIPGHYRVYRHGTALAVDVSDSRDAVDELTEVLSDALVDAYCYLPSRDELIANARCHLPGSEQAGDTPRLDGQRQSIDRDNHNYDEYGDRDMGSHSG